MTGETPLARSLPTLASVVALLSGAVLLFHEALFRGQSFVERDLVSYYRAAKSLLVPLATRSGGLPQWNPYFASGQPFAANPEHALFHPATWLFFIVPFEWAFRLQVLLPLAVAAASMAFLLRVLGRSAWATAFGAVTWAYGGYTLSVTNLLPTLLAISVLPAVLGFAVRAMRRGRGRDAGGLALAFGVECLAGDPVTLVMTPAAVLAAVLPGARRPTRARGLAAVGTGLGLGAAVAAVTLFSGLNLARKTVRASGLRAEAAEVWSMPPVRLLELVAPRALGHVEASPAGYWAIRFYPGKTTPFVYSLYPGLLASLLALSTVAVTAVRPRGTRSRFVLAWTTLAVMGIALALGAYGPLWPVARRLPIVSGLRYPEKFILLAMLPLTVLASTGLELVLRLRRSLRGLRRLLVVVAALAGSVAAFLLAGGSARATPARDTLGVALTALGYIVALALAQGGPRGALAILVATLLDLVSAGRRLVPTWPVETLTTPPPVIADLIESGLGGPVFHAGGWLAAAGGGYGYVRPPIPAFWRVPTIFEPDFDATELRWSAEATQAFVAVLTRAPRTGFAVVRRRGAGAIIRVRGDVSVEEGRLVIPAGLDSAVELRYLDRPQPFAFCPARVERFRGHEGWIEAVLRLGAQARWVVLLEAGEAASVPAAPAPCSVEADAANPSLVRLTVNAHGPGASLVAINQTWDEFWSARIDGRPVPILRTDLSLSSVAVPPGSHRLELAYDDPWLRRGAIVSVLAFAASLGLLRSRCARGTRAPD